LKFFINTAQIIFPNSWELNHKRTIFTSLCARAKHGYPHLSVERIEEQLSHWCSTLSLWLRWGLALQMATRNPSDYQLDSFKHSVQVSWGNEQLIQ